MSEDACSSPPGGGAESAPPVPAAGTSTSCATAPDRTTDYPPITAAICAFNAEEDIADCLHALVSMDHPPAEVIVVDNASTDRTAAIVRERFPQVRLISMPSNDGPCPPRNRGLAEAQHPLVLQLDQDVIVRPDTLNLLLQERTRTPDAAVIFPRAMDAGKEGIVHYDGGSFHYAGVMALRHFFQPASECTREIEDVDAFISLAALVDREKVFAVGGYDPAFFILFEDHDLSYRLRLAGYRIRAVPDAVVDHRAGTEGISFRGGHRYPARRLFLHSRNRWMAVLKSYRLRTLVLTLPGILLLGVAYVFFAWRQGALRDYVRAKSSLIRLIPKIREERKKIAAFRKLRDKDLLGAPDLTFSPRIERGRSGSLLERGLTFTLRVYWWLVRPWVG